jgi:hypothetical protein
MKFLVACAAAAFVFLSSASSPQQKSESKCDFALSGTRVEPSITGPEEIVAIAHVVDQPDSPVEIVSADFQGSFVSISNGQYADQLDCSIKVRNRSDRAIRSFGMTIGLAPGGIGIVALNGLESSSNLPNGRSLMPGEELEIKSCGTRGNGGAPNNRVRLHVAIEAVSFDGCYYVPSRRFAF